jgi:PhnB protein
MAGRPTCNDGDMDARCPLSYDARRQAVTARTSGGSPMATLSPYLGFDGDCEEAFEFYRSIFGGELQINRYSEMPPDSGIGPEQSNKIMHVSLPLGDGQTLMGSDRPPGSGSTTFGDSIAVMVAPSSSEEGRRIFEALAAGGSVTMPYEMQFWGDEFGQLVDRFGINWMVDYGPPQQ